MVKKNCLNFDSSFFKRATRATHQTTKYLFLFILGLAISATDVNAQILKRGSEGAAVRELQQNLLSQGFYEGSVTEVYDPLTQEAVKGFQISQGLEPDGIAGPRTQEALQKSVSLSATPTQLQSSSPTVLQSQTILQSATALVSNIPMTVATGALALIGFVSVSAVKQEKEEKKQTKATSTRKPKSFKIGEQTFWNIHGIDLGPFDTGTDVEIDIYNPENEKVISYDIHSNIDFDLEKFPSGEYKFTARGIHQGEAVEYTETSVNLS